MRFSSAGVAENRQFDLPSQLQRFLAERTQVPGFSYELVQDEVDQLLAFGVVVGGDVSRCEVPVVLTVVDAVDRAVQEVQEG